MHSLTATDMPTPLRNVRIPDDLWDSAQAKALADGVTVSDVIRGQLSRWVGADPRVVGVDSTTRQCCGGIGRHTPACRP